MVNPPLVTGEKTTKILDIIIPPELHLLTGTVGKLIKEFERKLSADKEEFGKQLMNNWVNQENIRRCVYQGSASLEGNQARKILSRLPSLENLCKSQEDEIYSKAKPFLQTLADFNSVVKSCFGQTLETDTEGNATFVSVIQKFSSSYRCLGISVPLKVIFDKSMFLFFISMIYIYQNK